MRALFAFLLVLAACQPAPVGPRPDVPVPDAALDAALVGDAPLPAGCAGMCIHLDAIGCHPLPTCTDACTRGVNLHLVDPDDVVKVSHAGNADAVRVIGGGFCR